MAQRRHHYERAFETYLRANRTPYVAVDEARRALLPPRARLAYDDIHGEHQALKSFDFLIYTSTTNFILDVKGRKLAKTSSRPTTPRLDSWVTREDVESLSIWGELFGEGFTPGFVFVYWCHDMPSSSLFEEIFEHEGRWYALRAVTLERYASAMKTRSPRWGTVHVPSSLFERISTPLAGTWSGSLSPREAYTPVSHGDRASQAQPLALP
ncbi:MAG: HYExAFE family protein [Phycisphaerales bacterium JB043]